MKNIEATIAKARKAFNSGVTKTYDFRIKQIKALQRLIDENEDQIRNAIKEDTRKPIFEVVVFEVDFMRTILRNVLDSLKEWMEPVKPRKPLPFLFDKVLIVPEPYGVVLVISAWNYPFVLSLDPLIGAIAAGNTAILKPSEYSPKVAALLDDLLPKYLDQNCYHVINGGAPETTEILKQRFDYIFYTGGCEVGKIIHQAASKYLTPTTLELGGKNPVYIDKTANLEIAASRIMFGRLINAGQTCVAPDYVLCAKDVQQEFITACWNVIKKWYNNDVKKSPDYGRILNERHFQRIMNLLHGANIAIGGSYDMNELFIEPTILTDVNENDPIMQEETFGPILPILNVANMDQAIDFINKKEKPLVIYVFSNDKRTHDFFIQNTSSGNLLVNDTIMHLSCDTIPFGGVGNSGMGRYHGKYSFDTFSHEKGTMIRSLDRFSESLQAVRYPPYTNENMKLIRKASKKLPLPSFKHVSGMLMFLLGITATLVINYIIKLL